MAGGTELNVRSIQFGMWANETALLGAYALAIGGVVGIIGGVIPLLQPFNFWLPIGIYGLVVGLLISIMEYPRGKKVKGNTIQRSFQSGFSSCMNAMPLVSNYYVRAVLYFIIVIPGGLIVPTLLGTICVIISTGIYMGAACHGEKWEMIVPWVPSKKQASDFAQPPSQPPPRLPQTQMQNQF